MGKSWGSVGYLPSDMPINSFSMPAHATITPVNCKYTNIICCYAVLILQVQKNVSVLIIGMVTCVYCCGSRSLGSYCYMGCLCVPLSVQRLTGGNTNGMDGLGG